MYIYVGIGIGTPLISVILLLLLLHGCYAFKKGNIIYLLLIINCLSLSHHNDPPVYTGTHVMGSNKMQHSKVEMNINGAYGAY